MKSHAFAAILLTAFTDVKDCKPILVVGSYVRQQRQNMMRVGNVLHRLPRLAPFF
jgi:hypothetical protein